MLSKDVVTSLLQQVRGHLNLPKPNVKFDAGYLRFLVALNNLWEKCVDEFRIQN